MIANKMDLEELKEVGGGWVYRDGDNGIYVLDDHTAEILDGPFYCVPDAEKRAKELGQAWQGISPVLLEQIRNKNKNQ